MSVNYPYYPVTMTRRTPVFGRAAVATSQYLATQAGLRILEKGGSAADAAIATAAMLTLVEPTGCGLGSDAFAIVHDGEKVHGLNSSGRAPAAWTREFFDAKGGIPKRGWDAVTVPGVVRGWSALWQRFGKLPFESLFEDAISQAERGFIVTPVVQKLWSRDHEILRDQPGFIKMFTENGHVPNVGQRFVNRGMADSFRAIAKTQGEDFYTGELAAKIIAFAKETGGSMTAADLEAHQADWVDLLQMDFGETTLYEIPPNGQGIAALIALNILKHTSFDKWDGEDWRGTHLQIEAMKLAFSDLLAHVADPDYMAFDPARLLDPSYGAERAALIDPNRAQVFGAGKPGGGGTVYLCAADEDGMMVSFIQSNYMGMGSGVSVPGTGIHFQNRGANFTMEKGHPNEVAPMKRPFHTIIPGFITGANGLRMATGVMGAFMQAQGHLQMLVRTQILGQDVQTAIDAPRWRFMEGNQVEVEEAFSQSLVQSLRDAGHDIKIIPWSEGLGFGGAQLIQTLPGGGYVAGSDPRKDGMALVLG